MLRLDELRAVSNALLRLHSLDDPDRVPAAVVDALRDLVPGTSYGYNEVDTARGRVVATREPAGFIDSRLEAAFAEHHRQHPLLQFFLESNDDEARTISDFLSPKEFHRLDLYGDVFARVGVEDQLCVGFTSGPVGIGVVVNRDRRSFDDRDRLVLGLLRQHLAVVRRHVAALSLARGATELQGFGTIRLDPSGAIGHADPWALRWLRRYFGRGAGSHEAVPDDLHVWLVDLAARQEVSLDALPSPLTATHCARRLTVNVASTDPDSGTVLLLREAACEPGSSTDGVANLGLTRREAEVVDLLDHGATDAEIADALVLSLHTVHKHLQNIYRKLGVRSRSAAVARLHGR